MVRRNWIVIGLCITAAVMLSTAAFGEKGEKKCSLPAAVEAAVKALFPKAVVDESKMDKESVKTYEVDVKDGNEESEITVAEDGTVLDVDSDETMDTVPAAVAAVIKAQNAEVKEVVKEVEYAQLKVVKLGTPVTSYEAEIIKDGEKTELKIAADGTILKQEVKEKKCDKEKDDNGKDEEHEGRDKD
jgi:hypothetical protein